MNDGFERVDEQPPDAGFDAVERALAGALAHRAGGPLATAAAADVDESRLEAIETAISSGASGTPAGRRGVVLLTAAAAVVAVLFLAVALARGSEDSTDVRTGDDRSSPTTVAVDPPGTTVPSDPVGGTTSVAVPGTTPTSSAPTATVAPTVTVAPSTTATPTLDIRDVDLRNFTYPTSLCQDIDRSEPTFTLVDGELRVGDEFIYDLMYLEGDVYVGDATGDGVDDAVTKIFCGPGATDGYMPKVVVVSMVDGTPRVVTSLPGSGRPLKHTATSEAGSYETTALDHVLDVGFTDGRLWVRWGQYFYGAPELDSRRMTITYRWNGASLDIVGEADVEVVPAEVQRPTAAEKQGAAGVRPSAP